ncbi:MAG: four-carbon acid sugar kinase family protein [Paracoccus sp. (in: a-proteobacteria)]|nr:four-carbon acid sugar kinase family protein [Paracoccus sp. (in: a-proteobacteria)]
MTWLGCIADDFTGATDLAALVARSGAPVSLRIGLPEPGAEPPGQIEVVALKIRSIPAAEAVAQALAALDWLTAAGAARIYWKYCSTFDSTAAGNIGPVADALAARLGAGPVLHVPSFPENGRRVFMGNLFVGRQPLAESPMKDHPLNPMTDSDLTRLLALQVRGRVGLIDWPAVAAGDAAVRAAIAGDMAHLIADAICDGDLDVLAGPGAEAALCAGGSAFARDLARQWLDQGRLTRAGRADAPVMPVGPALLLSGSCSDMTRRQVAAYVATGAPALRLDPVMLDARGSDAALDWLEAQRPDGPAPLIYATAEPDEVRAAQSRLGAGRAGQVVEDALARIARAARAGGVTRFVVAGGESSGAVASALGVGRLRIGAEIAPGVPWCLARDGQGPLALALKSGNFGGPDFFARALAG